MAQKMVPIPGGFNLLPSAPGTCEQCAVNHPPELPHNAQSLYYQYWFYGTNGRWPDWRDAMAHCTEKMRAEWTRRLIERGVDVSGGGVNPTK